MRDDAPSFRFLHLADLHLETGFGGREPARRRLREATLEAFEAAVDLALERGLHAVLVAGDLFDEPRLSPRVARCITRGVQRLCEGGVWLLYATGNHDPWGAERKARQWLELEAGEGERAGWRSRVVVFGEHEPRWVTVEDGEGRPVGRVVGAGHALDRVAENLAARFPERAAVDSGELPVVGLLHTKVEGSGGSGEHARYAPSRAADLEARDYEYWALGHIHLRGRAVPGVPAWYAGNLVGRHPREPGAKGGLLVEARAGSPAEPVFVDLAPTRWGRRSVSGLGELRGRGELLERLAREIEAAAREHGIDPSRLALRLELTGPFTLGRLFDDRETQDELEEELIERCGALEVQLRARGLHRVRDLGALRETPTVLGEALRMVVEMRASGECPAELVPAELAGLPAGDGRQEYLQNLLDGLEHELCERLLDPSSTPEGGP